MSLNANNLTFEASSAWPTVAHQVRRKLKNTGPKLLRIFPVDSGMGLCWIDSEPFVFGRDENCDVVVDENLASRRHAQFIRRGEHWFVEDLGSTNGTWVNEQKVQIQQLNSGDRIRIGRWTYKFFNEDNEESLYHESVYQMITRDALTGAWNKRYLMEVLDRELAKHRRTQQPLGLLMIDFDRFKQINDGHGHLVGDEVLTEFGRRVNATARLSDVFARFGGDEFAVLLANTDQAGACAAAKRIWTTVVEEPFATSCGLLDCSVSIGTAVCEAERRTSREDFLRQADQKLYQAKQTPGKQIF